jgi:hypothetical protein
MLTDCVVDSSVFFLWGWNYIFMALRLCSDNRTINCVCVLKGRGVFQIFSCLFIDLFLSYLATLSVSDIYRRIAG